MIFQNTSPRVRHPSSAISCYTNFQPVYDLTIDGWHTYYVTAGAEELLNHNENCPPCRRENKQILTKDQSDDVATWLGYQKTKDKVAGVGQPMIWKNKTAPAAERYIAQDTTGARRRSVQGGADCGVIADDEFERPQWVV